ncbi:NADP-dependent malic enzyme [hydrothermal vent metagenome]|uniref:NADP-dependent malic enzyme n=1 Tax=hydrothermal vent metagenome TaxID=652676 RepID=A0A3B0W9R6_9ZZZZ
MADDQKTKDKNEKDQEALDYHQFPTPGKLEICATKPLVTQNDLALAYSPGVAAACTEIYSNPEKVADYTIRSNLVGVITNGSAVLGLGNIGPLASKPVMEGKAVLFKRFSNIDVFDIEINQPDVDKFVDTVVALEPTFGGINLEDIKAPECFDIERRLRERMNIPVFHDDQHGTAIIVTAAILSGLKVVGKKIEDIHLVTSGAGAAALACLNQLVSAGLQRENIIVTDILGVAYKGRKEEMDEWKSVYASDTKARTLREALDGADVFLGLSAPEVLKPDMLKNMTKKPLILALANPTPEILPELAKEARPDALICTGRSDYPNQVNNVLCFPFIFRGALDVGATTINEEMKLACVKALSELVQKEASDDVLRAYGGKPDKFGAEYLIPKPFDPRLVVELSMAVAEAAMVTGVATRPIKDFYAYREKLQHFVNASGFFMRPIMDRVKGSDKKLVYAEGEEFRVLQAAQQVVDNEIARPVLIGNHDAIAENIDKLGLRIREEVDIDIIDPQHNAMLIEYADFYHELMGRKGVTPGGAQHIVKHRHTILAALMLKSGHADAMIAGVVGGFTRSLNNIINVIGKAEGINQASTIVAHVLPSQTVFICDAHVTKNPSISELVETTLLAAAEVRSFGIEPKIALVSHSNFGASKDESAEKMRKALMILHEVEPHLEVEGEMHADAALSEKIRNRLYPHSKLKGVANLLIMPSADAANISMTMLKVLGGGVTIGPILMGMSKSAHVVAQAITVRNLVNMSAVAVEHSMR